MAKLTTKQRNALPASVFVELKKRAYPMPDRAHAIAAKSRAAQFASPALKKRVDQKANAVLGKKRGRS